MFSAGLRVKTGVQYCLSSTLCLHKYCIQVTVPFTDAFPVNQRQCVLITTLTSHRFIEGLKAARTVKLVCCIIVDSSHRNNCHSIFQLGHFSIRILSFKRFNTNKILDLQVSSVLRVHRNVTFRFINPEIHFLVSPVPAAGHHLFGWSSVVLLVFVCFCTPKLITGESDVIITSCAGLGLPFTKC